MYELELHLLIDDDPRLSALLIEGLTHSLLDDPAVVSVTAWPDPDHPIFDTTAASN